MTPKKRLEGLEQACRDHGVRLVYDDLQGEGGMCRLRDNYMIVINRRAAADTRVRIIGDALERIQAARSRQAAPSLTAPADEAVPGLPVPARRVPVEGEQQPAAMEFD
jgi:hypothetical protein